MTPPLLTQVLEVASDVFGVAPSSLSAASSPDSVENWDSVQHLNLVLALEARFGVQINPEDIDKLKTLGAAEKILATLGAR